MPKPNLTNTTWIVPKKNLPAYVIDKNNYASVVDQTVWKITSQEGNYFFGYAYANIGGNYSKSYLSGSILDDNSVQINFENVSNQKNIIGYGKYINGKFQMQMIDNEKNFNVIHASWMISVECGDKYYRKLPGSKIFNGGKSLSVNKFIKKCDNSI